MEEIRTLAALTGWLVYHPHDSRKSEKGFPDLTLTKGGRLVLFECKTEKGRVRPEQETWMVALSLIPGVTARIVRPSDWPEIERTLKGEG